LTSRIALLISSLFVFFDVIIDQSAGKSGCGARCRAKASVPTNSSENRATGGPDSRASDCSLLLSGHVAATSDHGSADHYGNDLNHVCSPFIDACARLLAVATLSGSIPATIGGFP
jgi:hypothetical protein